MQKRTRLPKKLGALEADICELKSMAAAACKPFSKAEKVGTVILLFSMPS